MKKKRKTAATRAAKKAKVTSKVTHASRRKRPAALPESLNQRVGTLERFVATLASDTYARHEYVGTPKSLAADAVVDGDLVDLHLTKLDTSPDLVRVTRRDGGDVVLAPGVATGVVPNVVVDSFIELVVEVTGNPGDMAAITVTGAVPDSIKVRIPMNTGKMLAIRSLLVIG